MATPLDPSRTTKSAGTRHLTLDDHIGGTAYGDADEMTDHAQGGNDTLRGGFEATNNLFGDANVMSDNSRGGDDTLFGGFGLTNRAANFVYGDAYSMSDNAQGGNDTLRGGTITPSISSTATPSPCPTTRAVAMTR